jgi:hypothetical protein
VNWRHCEQAVSPRSGRRSRLLSRVYREEIKDGTAKPRAKKQLCSSAKTILTSMDAALPLNDFGRAAVWAVREASSY